MDERFLDNERRREHRSELDALLEAAVGRITCAEALDRLAKAGVPSAPINTVDEALSDPQVLERDMVVTLQGRGDSIRAVGNPLKFPGGRDVFLAPPRLGEDTDRVLRDFIGLNDARMEELAANGAIGPTMRSTVLGQAYA